MAPARLSPNPPPPVLLACSSGGPRSSGGKAAGAAGLLDAPVNSYFDVPAGILPEATAEFYRDPLLKVGPPAAGRLGGWVEADSVLLPVRHTLPKATCLLRLPCMPALLTPVCARACCLCLQGENVHEPNYGCRGVQQEWEVSGRRPRFFR